VKAEPAPDQMSSRVRRLRKESLGLDITAFMNMIVVLVPFLLTTTVFSRLAVLELSLPAQSSGFEQAQGRSAARGRDPGRRARRSGIAWAD